MNKNKTRLLLIEIILAIMFFSLASGVCMQLFAKASLISKDNNNKLQSISVLQSFQGVLTKNDIAYTAQFFNGEYTDDSITIYYDNNWQVANENIMYTLQAVNTDLDNWRVVILNVNTENEILTQDLTIHKPMLLQEVYSNE